MTSVKPWIGGDKTLLVVEARSFPGVVGSHGRATQTICTRHWVCSHPRSHPCRPRAAQTHARLTGDRCTPGGIGHHLAVEFAENGSYMKLLAAIWSCMPADGLQASTFWPPSATPPNTRPQATTSRTYLSSSHTMRRYRICTTASQI